MKLTYLFAVLRTMRVPGLFPIIKDWQAHVRMHFLHAAIECGLLDALPGTWDELMERLDVKRPELLSALLDVGLAAKELRRKGEVYSLRGKRARAVQRYEGDALAAMVQAQVTYYSDVFRKAAGRMQGGALGQDLHEIGDLVARYSKLAESVLGRFLEKLMPHARGARILDLGCGSGVFLRRAHEKDAQASGYGLETDPAVAVQARTNLDSWGIAGAFSILEGDMRNPPQELAGPFDIITLFNVLYYFPPEERIAVLRRVRSLLAPGGVLGIAMNFHSHGRDLNAASLNMVNVSLEGLTPLPGLQETMDVLKECGFSEVEPHGFFPGGTFCGIKARA